MGTREQLETALEEAFEPGEEVVAWRTVVANGRVEDSAYETTLALLGPTVFLGAAGGTVTGVGAMPRNTNLVVVTGRRLLWCHKSRLGNEFEVLGGDTLATVHSVEYVPARIAFAKLRFVFHDRSAAQFDLPTDHKAEEFVDDVKATLRAVPAAA